jgi:hypothetical protein
MRPGQSMRAGVRICRPDRNDKHGRKSPALTFGKAGVFAVEEKWFGDRG